MKDIITYILKQVLAAIVTILGGIWWIKKKFRNDSVLLILNYHNFSKYNNYKIKRGNILETAYAENFEKQIRFLKKHFNFCYPEEFFAGRGKSGINLLITFDDGYKDNYDIALPLLKKHTASAIFFITTNFMNGNKWLWHDKVRYLAYNGQISAIEAEDQLLRMNHGYSVGEALMQTVENRFPESIPKRLMMCWKEVGQVAKSGFVIGSHTCNHTIMSALPEQEQRKEIQESRLNIIKHTGKECSHFAYPNGQFNNSNLKLLKESKIKFAYTTKGGFNKITTSNLKLGRIGVNTSDSIFIIILKLLINCK